MHCSVLNKRVNNLSDQLSTDVIDSTKKGNMIPRNICGRIWDAFIVVISYIYIYPGKWFFSSILIKLTFSLNKPINFFSVFVHLFIKK